MNLPSGLGLLNTRGKAYLADIVGLTITGRFWMLSLVNSCTMNLPLLRIIEEEPVLFPEPTGEALLTAPSNPIYHMTLSCIRVQIRAA